MTYDPSDYSVTEVNAYLDDHPDETTGVLQSERDGKARVGIIDGAHAHDLSTEGATFAQVTEDLPAPTEPPSTKGLTFADAAAAATPAPAGEDKGLSQRNPAVMGLPVDEPTDDDQDA